MKPGNLAGGFAHYRASHAGRIAMMKDQAPALPPITVPTCVRWAEHDPLFPYAWTDRLGETFADVDCALFSGVGHYPHREDPDRSAEEIEGFFTRIGWLRVSKCACGKSNVGLRASREADLRIIFNTSSSSFL